MDADLQVVLDELRELRKELRTGTNRLLKVDEAATKLGISERTLRNRLGPRATKPFPVRPVKVAGRVLFRVSDLDQYIDGLKGG